MGLVSHLHRALLCAGLALNGTPAFADEGGLSFWLPGQYGSLAATQTQPGWSWATLYIHPDSKAAAGTAFPKGGRLDLGVSGRGDLVGAGPTYTFQQPVLGGQLSISLLGLGGYSVASVSGTLTGPSGGSVSGDKSQSITGLGDLLPQASLKWNFGVDNWMVYGTGDIPVGRYDPSRLANLGLGHGAIDGGGGYTYFDPTTGHEFSAVAGLTYNLENPDTKYKNGVDFHLDWGASQFLSEHVHVGVVGYYFQQITGDSGSGAVLGDFESRVAGIGPQIGLLFPIGEKVDGYLNVKAYKEFAAKNRPG